MIRPLTGACLALALLISPAAWPIDGGKNENPSIPALSAFTDDVIGFSLKRPAGWRLRYTTGVIAVLKDDQATEGVLIYPVKPQAGFTLQAFLTSYLTVLKASPGSATKIGFSDVAADPSVRAPGSRAWSTGRRLPASRRQWPRTPTMS